MALCQFPCGPTRKGYQLSSLLCILYSPTWACPSFFISPQTHFKLPPRNSHFESPQAIKSHMQPAAGSSATRGLWASGRKKLLGPRARCTCDVVVVCCCFSFSCYFFLSFFVLLLFSRLLKPFCFVLMTTVSFWFPCAFQQHRDRAPVKKMPGLERRVWLFGPLPEGPGLLLVARNLSGVGHLGCGSKLTT